MEKRVTAVTVGAGDLLLIRYDGVLSQDDMARIREGFQGVLPGVEFALEVREQVTALKASSLAEAARLAAENPGRAVEVD